MAVEDYFDFSGLDEEGDADDHPDITCRRCGIDGLFWEQARGERNQNCWVLIDPETENIHICPPISPLEFKDCA